MTKRQQQLRFQRDISACPSTRLWRRDVQHSLCVFHWVHQAWTNRQHPFRGCQKHPMITETTKPTFPLATKYLRREILPFRLPDRSLPLCNTRYACFIGYTKHVNQAKAPFSCLEKTAHDEGDHKHYVFIINQTFATRNLAFSVLHLCNTHARREKVRWEMTSAVSAGNILPQHTSTRNRAQRRNLAREGMYPSKFVAWS